MNTRALKTIFTAMILLVTTTTSFAQKFAYKAIKDLVSDEKVDYRFFFDIKKKTLKIEFVDDGTEELYKIKDYYVTKDEENDDIYPEGVKFTEYLIKVEDREDESIGFGSFYLNIPNQNNYVPTLVVYYNRIIMDPFYFIVEKINK